MENIYILLKEFHISTTLYSYKHYPELFYYLILSFFWDEVTFMDWIQKGSFLRCCEDCQRGSIEKKE